MGGGAGGCSGAAAGTGEAAGWVVAVFCAWGLGLLLAAFLGGAGRGGAGAESWLRSIRIGFASAVSPGWAGWGADAALA